MESMSTICVGLTIQDITRLRSIGVTTWLQLHGLGLDPSTLSEIKLSRGALAILEAMRPKGP